MNNTNQTVKTVGVGFYKTKRSGFAVSHNKGLTAEQVEMLHGVKEGQRLRLWTNEPREGYPDFNLGVMAEEQETR